MLKSHRLSWWLVSLMILAIGSSRPAVADAIDGKPITDALQGAIERLARDGDIAVAYGSIEAIADAVVLGAGPKQFDLFRDVAFHSRLVRQLAAVDDAHRAESLEILMQNPDLAWALCFAVRPGDNVDKAYALMRRLHASRPEYVNRYANLTAALCVVHDRRLTRDINENSVSAPSPTDLFDYYVANEGRMFFGVRPVPVEMLVYVVDSTASIGEMRWALDRYAGHRSVGQLFFTIEYDYDHAYKGTAKEVTRAGFTLPNILQHGGVCADQAYFAVAVGKSIGVPTAYTRGQSSVVSHAWVGFLEANNAASRPQRGQRRAWWNSTTGRWEAYQGVLGVVEDPQTRQSIPDSYLSLLASHVLSAPLDRRNAAALTDMSRRLLGMDPRDGEMPVYASPVAVTAVREQEDVAAGLELLKSGLELAPGYASGWMTIADLAESQRLDLPQIRTWAQFLHRLCGRDLPDFYLTIVTPMIESIPGVEEQNKLWNAAFAQFSHRHDLAASVRLRQASMWREAGHIERAGQCYEDVISRYANVGPFIVAALRGAEDLLREKRDGRRLLQLYESAWGSIRQPDRHADQFFRQSNWYRVGKRYAEVLREAGLNVRAQQVLGALDDTRRDDD